MLGARYKFVNPKPYTLHTTHYTLRTTLHTLHPTPYTLYSTLHTLHPTLHTPHSTPSTPPNPKPQEYHIMYDDREEDWLNTPFERASNPTPHTLHTTHRTLHTSLYTLHTTHYTLHTSLYTLHPTPCAPHSTLYITPNPELPGVPHHVRRQRGGLPHTSFFLLFITLKPRVQ